MLKLQVSTTVYVQEVPNELPVVASVEVDLTLGKELDIESYYTGNVLNKSGVKLVTAVLVQGLVSNIAGAHIHGIRDQDDHIQFIHDEINRSISANPQVKWIATNVSSEGRCQVVLIQAALMTFATM